MTKAEYKYITELYVHLMKNKNRTELEQLRYIYCDKVIGYVMLASEARRAGNKHPEENFIIQKALEHMKEAEQNLRAYLQNHTQSEESYATV